MLKTLLVLLNDWVSSSLQRGRNSGELCKSEDFFRQKGAGARDIFFSKEQNKKQVVYCKVTFF